MSNSIFYEIGRQISIMAEVKSACRNFVGKSDRKRLLGGLNVGAKTIFK
jgi:hypothetical protein